MPSAQPRPPDAPATVAAKGSRKGEETRRRILDVALREFGALGFAGASTRRIAARASVNLPALRYYFGGKQGLYLACAREVVGEYQAVMQSLQAEVRRALAAGMTREAARANLKAFLQALVDVQIGAQRADVWMTFVQREIAEQGAAFRLLFESLWAPGVDLVADLISRIRGEPARTEAARLRALLLVSSLAAFGAARPIALEYLDWPALDTAALQRIKRAFDEQIDQIG
jgi:TetR/AcrR family transcriptional regulator, regulator of cefoperazone and chloramphenicol sensitivity